MKIRIHPHARVCAATVALGAMLATGCAASSNAEQTASTRQADLTTTEAINLTNTNYFILTATTDLSASDLTVTNNQAVLTPSATLADRFLGGSHDPADHTITITVPTVDVPLGGAFGDYTVSIPSLTTTSFNSALMTSDMHVQIAVTGWLHGTSVGNGPAVDLPVTGTIDPYVGAASGALSLDQVAFNLQTQVQSCTSGTSVCQALAAAVPTINAMLSSDVPPLAQSFVTSAQTYDDFIQTLFGVAGKMFGLTISGWTLSEVPSVQNGTLSYEVVAELPTDPDCTAQPTPNCDGSVTIVCQPNAYMLQNYQIDPTTFVNVPVGLPVAPSHPSTMMSFVVAPGAGVTEQYVVCALDNPYDLCSRPMTVTGGPYTCGRGGSSGGGSSGGGSSGGGSSGGGGRPCGGHVCLQ